MEKPKKSLGQNFLIDPNTIRKIVESGKLNNHNLIEIGPGTGNLTNELIKSKNKKITLIEKDKLLYNKLKLKFTNNTNIEIVNSDILKVNLEKLVKKNTIIFGNLPYNISSQILISLIKFENWLPKYTRLILMFQKEMADRIIAKRNTKNYGRLSVIVNHRLDIIESFHISRNCFFPKPKVESTLLVFQPKKIEGCKIKDIKNLEKITNFFFNSKRKMINKKFKSLFKDFDLIAKELNINLSSRPSELSPLQYCKITEYFENLT